MAVRGSGLGPAHHVREAVEGWIELPLVEGQLVVALSQALIVNFVQARKQPVTRSVPACPHNIPRVSEQDQVNQIGGGRGTMRVVHVLASERRRPWADEAEILQ